MKSIFINTIDTCLVRRCGNQNDVFYLLSRRLFENDTTSADMFYCWRCRAEELAKAQLNKNEVSLHDIYTIISKEILGSFSTERIYQIELQLEAECLRTTTNARNFVELKREKGYAIIFINNSCLPSEFLKTILINERIAKECDKILMNSEINDLNEENQKITIKTLNSEYNKVEKLLMAQTAYLPCKMQLSCLIGNLRYIRLANNKDKLHSDISADFVTPIFTSYVAACLQKAQNEGFDRLYFMARDGYILRYIADKLKSFFSNIDIRYLYVSRKSMFLPSLTSVDKDEIGNYFGRNKGNVSQVLINTYFKQKDWDNIEVLKQSKDTRLRINAYFKQEGVFDKDSKYALVDVGWKGSGRYAFNKLQKLQSLPEREMWYLGTFSRWRQEFPGKFWTYNLFIKLPKHFITLVEDYFSASPDLSTVDYRIESNGLVSPVFDDSSRIDNREILVMNKKSIDEFTSFVLSYNLLDNHHLELLSEKCTNILIDNPEYLDLSCFDKMNFFSENGIQENWVRKVGPLYILRFILGQQVSGWADANVFYSHAYSYKYLKKIRGISMQCRKMISL